MINWETCGVSGRYPFWCQVASSVNSHGSLVSNTLYRTNHINFGIVRLGSISLRSMLGIRAGRTLTIVMRVCVSGVWNVLVVLLAHAPLRSHSQNQTESIDLKDFFKLCGAMQCAGSSGPPVIGCPPKSTATLKKVRVLVIAESHDP